MIERADLERCIRDFLHEELRADAEGLGVTDPLVTSGLLDSAGLVRLAALIERETDRLIPDRDLTPEHFDSIAKILAYIEATAAG